MVKWRKKSQFRLIDQKSPNDELCVEASKCSYEENELNLISRFNPTGHNSSAQRRPQIKHIYRVSIISDLRQFDSTLSRSWTDREMFWFFNSIPCVSPERESGETGANYHMQCPRKLRTRSKSGKGLKKASFPWDISFAVVMVGTKTDPLSH